MLSFEATTVGTSLPTTRTVIAFTLSWTTPPNVFSFKLYAFCFMSSHLHFEIQVDSQSARKSTGGAVTEPTSVKNLFPGLKPPLSFPPSPRI